MMARSRCPGAPTKPLLEFNNENARVIVTCLAESATLTVTINGSAPENVDLGPLRPSPTSTCTW